MAEYYARVSWSREDGEMFVDNEYSRGHEWIFDGGVTVLASSSPHVVPLPYSIEAHVDPEEAFVASLSSCHMLFFLSIAAKKKFVVDQYIDNAVGVMGKNCDGKVSVTKVTLRPEVMFAGGTQPSVEQLEEMHHRSHEQCFIANSVRTDVAIEVAMCKSK